jgi:hypothetical protein
MLSGGIVGILGMLHHDAWKSRSEEWFFGALLRVLTCKSSNDFNKSLLCLIAVLHCMVFYFRSNLLSESGVCMKIPKTLQKP